MPIKARRKVKRHQHTRPDSVLMINKPEREQGIRTSTKKKPSRRIVSTGQDENRTYELHSTKGYRSQKKLKEKDNVITI